MKTSKRLAALLICLAFVLALFTAFESTERVNSLEGQINDLQGNYDRLTENYAELKTISSSILEIRSDYESELMSQIEKLQKELDGKLDAPPETPKTSRGGDRPKKMTMRATAYDLSYESCGKLPSHPEYGITASGEPVREWYTCASGPEIPFGTQVYIPEFAGYPNKGWFVVQDRGSAVKRGCIDIYMADGDTCRDFGVKWLDVYVLEVSK
jgi:3D (Asp-Asp-Asp) domain-containing protein